MAVYNGDCLEVMRDFSANSIDLLFCDLPYGETACKWDCKIDLETFWKEINRICKINCPMFFTTTTRFGVELINSNPKNFRYDLVWIKSASAGFLNAKKMPMRKHELIYVFYRKLPFYDLSSHSHKFLNSISGMGNDKSDTVYKTKAVQNKQYDPPLPASVIHPNVYGGTNKKERTLYRNEAGLYEPPLPNSIIKEDGFEYEPLKNTMYGDITIKKYPNTADGKRAKDAPIYDPPLPNSILDIKSQKGKHSTQKPTALMEWILKYYSKEGDTVLDPTMGSGSTGVACKAMNRNFIGIEKDDKIYKDAVERINKI